VEWREATSHRLGGEMLEELFAIYKRRDREVAVGLADPSSGERRLFRHPDGSRRSERPRCAAVQALPRWDAFARSY